MECKVGEFMPRKRSKYGVDITEKGKKQRTYQGVQYDSVMEMQFYIEYIEPRIKSGEIISCKRQQVYVLQESYTNIYGKKILAIKYKSDFDVVYKDGNKVVYDVKGRADNTALLKRKLFWYKYPDVDYRWMTRSLKYSDTGWLEYDELKKIRREEKKKKEKN